MTQEIKYGRYDSVCMLFLNQEQRTSFNSNARIIGAGNPVNIFKKLMTTVFRKMSQNVLFDRKS